MAGTAVTVTPEFSTSPESVVERLRASLNLTVDDLADFLPSSVQSTVVGNVGAGVDDLMTYSIPADALNAAGNFIRIRGWGKAANNATAKNLLLLFGGTSLLGTLALTASQVGTWYVDAIVIRTGSDTQDFVASVREGVGATLAAGKQAILFGTATIDEDATIITKFQGEGGADNDVTQEALIVEIGRVAGDLAAFKVNLRS